MDGTLFFNLKSKETMKILKRKYVTYILIFFLGAYSGRANFENVKTFAGASMGTFEICLDWLGEQIETQSKRARRKKGR